MSVRNPFPGTIIFDTNTIMEPINVCVCDRQYRVDDGKMLKYLIVEENGQEWLYINEIRVLPVRRILN